jgi:DNA-binding response OmpR family regulator
MQRHPMQPDIPLGRPVVLIVDDTPDNLAMLSSALVAAGYAVLVALDGASALERIARLTPDVILLDAIMPGMDGFETCEQIKSNDLYKHIPVIFMTALADTQHVVQGFRVGGIDYVTKPIRPDEVVARIAAHVRRAASQRHADIVLELNSRAAVIATAQGEVHWHSALAPQRLAYFYGNDSNVAIAAGPLTRLPGALTNWLLGLFRCSGRGPGANRRDPAGRRAAGGTHRGRGESRHLDRGFRGACRWARYGRSGAAFWG